MHPSWSKALGIALLAGALAAAAAGAAEVPGNRIANGEFDSDLVGWDELFPEISEFQYDDFFDAHGCGSSAAARGINTNNVDFGSAIFSTCTTDVTAGESLLASARFLFPNGTSDGRAYLALSPYSDTDCNGALPGASTPFALTSNGTGVWQTSALDPEYPLVVPEGTQSLQVAVFLVKFTGSDPVIDVLFDEVRLTPFAWIFADDFELGEACRWSAVND